MNRLIIILLLTIIWCGFSNSFIPENVLLGLLCSSACYYTFHDDSTSVNRINIIPLVNLTIFMLIEVFDSAFRVIKEIIIYNQTHYSRVIEVPIKSKSDIEKSIVGNLITLTPGSLFIDFSPKKDHILVHTMFGRDEEETIHFITNILEPKVLEVFGGD